MLRASLIVTYDCDIFVWQRASGSVSQSATMTRGVGEWRVNDNLIKSGEVIPSELEAISNLNSIALAAMGTRISLNPAVELRGDQDWAIDIIIEIPKPTPPPFPKSLNRDQSFLQEITLVCRADDSPLVCHHAASVTHK